MESSFTPQELLHYGRQINLTELGLAGQQLLKKARVLCVGVGGLGSSALYYLTAAGVGNVAIIDDDIVEISNLQRQILFTYDDIAKPKVFAAETRLQQINPAVKIIPHFLRLSAENVLSLFADYDIILDGSDNFATRYLVNDACVHLRKPHVYASIAQFKGQCSVLTTKQGPCFRCLFAIPPPANLVLNCADAGVLGVLPGIMGSIQATETLKLILNIGQSLIGRILFFDALTMQFSEWQITPNPECIACQKREPFHQLPRKMTMCAHHAMEITLAEFRELKQQDFFLLDVREPDEYAQCNMGATLIPLSELKYRLTELPNDQLIIIHCKSGRRSLQAAQILLGMGNGFNKVKSLQGGITAWLETCK